MHYNIYSIYDRKAGVWLTPIFSFTNGTIGRELMGAMRDQNHPLCMYSGDYDLHWIGAWNAGDCGLTVLEKPVFICNLEVLRSGSFMEGE